MSDRYIWGAQLLVEDVPGAKRWLCENLFFAEEDQKGIVCLRNGNFRIILREDREHLADKYGPDDMCLGLRHIALETHDIEAAIAYCESRGLELQLGENGGPRYSGKVYGTGMNYFNIISGYGFTIEVSQKLHKQISPQKTLICGLEHIGLQVSDLSAAIQFYENLGFKPCFEPVVNHADGHTILCCMVAAGDTVIEIYKFHDLSEVPVQKHPVIDKLILGGNDCLYGTALEQIKLMEAKACTI